MVSDMLTPLTTNSQKKLLQESSFGRTSFAKKAQ
uniref:Uncharacterized protein n=1 Tax=Rhizophora mucronata TaxID=61149 RepID=A0A2P2NYC0_RHIMU